MPTPPSDIEGPVPRSIGRVLDLLEIVLAERRCNLTTAASASGLTPTTARRHLRALESRGYVVRDGDGQYSAGPTLMRIAAGVRDGGPLERLIRVAEPYLEQLADETGESAYLAVSDGETATYVARVESDHAIRHVGWVGQNVTLDGTAVGAALAEPGRTAVRTGAVEPDITAVSRAIVFDGQMGTALSVIGPRHRLDASRRAGVRASVESVADQLSRALGTSAVAS